jgi:nucleoid DNA-binding protein
MKLKNTDINKHISELLFLHDFVTIPNFGSFVTNYKSAEITETGILPPSKSISFNSVLKTDDGLLISYLSEILKTDYNTCKSLVSEFVKDIFTDLDNHKQVKFENIGTFEFNKKLNLIFEPKLKLNFLADSFGFSTTHFSLLEQTSTKLEKTLKDRSKLKKSLLSPTAKILYFVIPILILMSVLSIKTNVFDKSNYNYSNIGDIIFNDNNPDKSIIEKKLDSMTKKENALMYIEVKPINSKNDSNIEKELKIIETIKVKEEPLISENNAETEKIKEDIKIEEDIKEGYINTFVDYWNESVTYNNKEALNILELN